MNFNTIISRWDLFKKLTARIFLKWMDIGCFYKQSRYPNILKYTHIHDSGMDIKMVIFKASQNGHS